jgi:hypothetical protein
MPSYGDGQELSNLQASAPMAATPGPKAPSVTAINQAAAQSAQGQPMQQQQPLVPLNAPTQRPNEPVTTGLSSGPGLGPNVLGAQQTENNYNNARQYLQSMANNPLSSPALKAIAARFNESF